MTNVVIENFKLLSHKTKKDGRMVAYFCSISITGVIQKTSGWRTVKVRELRHYQVMRVDTTTEGSITKGMWFEEKTGEPILGYLDTCLSNLLVRELTITLIEKT